MSYFRQKRKGRIRNHNHNQATRQTIGLYKTTGVNTYPTAFLHEKNLTNEVKKCILSIRTLRGARFAIRIMWQLYLTVFEQVVELISCIYIVLTCIIKNIYVRNHRNDTAYVYHREPVLLSWSTIMMTSPRRDLSSNIKATIETKILNNLVDVTPVQLILQFQEKRGKS